MCYHISFEVKLESISEIFPDMIIDNQLDIEFPTDGYINGFDHRPQQVISRNAQDDKLHLSLMVWGFLPPGIKNYTEAEKFWNGYKDESGKWHTGFMTLNAVGEEVLDKKLFRDAALQRRCIIFTDGFYEWHHHFPVGKKGQQLKTSVKYPHHVFSAENPGGLMMMAGLWNPWKHDEVDPETGEVKTFITPTFAIMTTEANSLMEKIHNSKKRMPVVLTKELAEEWLRDDLSEERIKEIATWKFPADKLKAHTVSKDFQKSGSPKGVHSYVDFGVLC